jgi:hypothetical protein
MKESALKIAVKVFCRRQPFRAFAVELKSGDRVIVKHPEALIMRGELAVYFNPKTGYRLFDGDGVCQVLDLAAVE